MKDREFLIWLHGLLIIQGNNYNVDYLGKLRSIINEYPKEKITPNTLPDIKESENA